MRFGLFGEARMRARRHVKRSRGLFSRQGNVRQASVHSRGESKTGMIRLQMDTIQ